MRWFVIWIASAVMLVSAVLIPYLSLPLFIGGKGSTSVLLFPPQAFPTLMLAGVVGLAVGTIGIWRTSLGSAGVPAQGHGIRLRDIGAPIGLALGALALMGVLTAFIGPRIGEIAGGPDPCQSMHDISCFNAHPDYYQPTGPGDYAWSTPSSRAGEAVGPFFLIAWPLAVAGALISMLSLAT